MAIQLNDRDHLIFKLIDEHEVLLEKHISWFIAGDEKPVLIRDRLRKLFYLDYLICHRHGSKLPWWTTPTKPLVYMLSSMARQMEGLAESPDDVMDNDFQRHHLEVANLRMLFLVAQKNGEISNFQWTTIKGDTSSGLNAIVTFMTGGRTLKVGLVNNLSADESKLERLKETQEQFNLDHVLIISRDEISQKSLTNAVSAWGKDLSGKAFFATHQDIYKEGMIGINWQTVVSESNGNVVQFANLNTPIAV